MPFNTILSSIKQHLEYPIGLFIGFIGKSLGFGNLLQINYVAERTIDGVIGLIFLCIGVVLTHYIKKALNKDEKDK